MDKSDKILPSASPTKHGMKNTIEATDYFLDLFFGLKTACLNVTLSL